MKTTTLKVSLPVDLARFVQDSVQSGAYASASEVIRDGLRLLERSAHRGFPGADEFDRAKVEEALAGLRRLAASQTLGGDISPRGLVEERMFERSGGRHDPANEPLTPPSIDSPERKQGA